MIEFHIEALVETIGKRFARRIVPVYVLMTDRAHGDIRRGELCQMTAGASLVSGKARSRGIVIAAMAIVAGK